MLGLAEFGAGSRWVLTEPSGDADDRARLLAAPENGSSGNLIEVRSTDSQCDESRRGRAADLEVHHLDAFDVHFPNRAPIHFKSEDVSNLRDSLLDLASDIESRPEFKSQHTFDRHLETHDSDDGTRIAAIVPLMPQCVLSSERIDVSGSGVQQSTGPTLALDGGRGDNHIMVMQGDVLREVRRLAAVRGREAIEQRARSMAAYEQHLIETEVAATRRALLRLARRVDRTPGVSGYLDADFLAWADRSTIAQAVVAAALTIDEITAVDFQVLDAHDDTLRIQASHGFAVDFLSHFRTVKRTGQTACAVAWRSRRSVLIDHVASSPLFASTPGRDVMLAAGSRAVYSYPLLSGTGDPLGVLSFHAARPVTDQTQPAAVARSAALALAIVA